MIEPPEFTYFQAKSLWLWAQFNFLGEQRIRIQDAAFEIEDLHVAMTKAQKELSQHLVDSINHSGAMMAGLVSGLLTTGDPKGMLEGMATSLDRHEKAKVKSGSKNESR